MRYLEQLRAADSENIYGPEIERYLDMFMDNQRLMAQQLDLLAQLHAPTTTSTSTSTCGNRSTGKGHPLLRDVLCTGRVVSLLTERTACPRVAVVLCDPYQPTSLAIAASHSTSSSDTVSEAGGIVFGKGAGAKGEVSALASARAALTGTSTSTSGKSAASSATGGQQQQQQQQPELHVWVFIPLTALYVGMHGASTEDPPDAAGNADNAHEHDHSLPPSLRGVEPESFSELNLDLIREIYGECRDDSPGARFLVCRVPISTIAAVYSQQLELLGTTEGSTRCVSVHILQLQLATDCARLTPKDHLDVRKEFGVQDLYFADRQEKISANAKSMGYFSTAIPLLADRFLLAYKIRRAQQKLQAIKHFVSDKSMSLFPDFQQRLEVLTLLGYVERNEHALDGTGGGGGGGGGTGGDAGSSECVITRKGRAACELNTCDELLGTEILFNNVLEPLNPPEVAAMLSALVFQEKNDLEEALTSRMEVARASMMQILEQITTLQELKAVEVDPDSRPVLNFGLCTVVYQWARGVSFKDITGLTEFQEGSIVRAITRLDELCRDFQNAAVVIGNPSLYNKMEAASQCIKRDIVFAASLYIT